MPRFSREHPAGEPGPAGPRRWARWIAGTAWWRWIAHRVQNLIALGGVVLASGLALAVVALWGLSALTEEVLEGETLRFDEGVLLWIAQWATDRRDILALDITALGGGTVVLALAVVSASLLALLGRRWYALLICVSVTGGWIMSPVLKALFARPRPQVVEWRTLHAGQASFPSGHATMSMVLFVTLAYVIHRLGNRWWISVLAWTAAGVLVTMIGLTRLYLGVHYPSDVLAGYAVGFSWAVFCAAGIEMLRREKKKDE